MSGRLVGAIDQGTSSSRFLVFDSLDASVICQKQIEFQCSYPEQGWAEVDPWVLVDTVKQCVSHCVSELGSKSVDLRSIGITNQRETTVVWDKNTGQPLYNAIIWLDARTQTTVDKLLNGKAKGDKDVLRQKCGLPISTYFSAVKLKWLFDNVPTIAESAKADRLCFGTVDSWLMWNLIKEHNGKRIHVTDVTNASRTMLMDLKTLNWDPELLSFFDLPQSGLHLPEIRSSSEVYGVLDYEGCPCVNVPVAGCLGDQQAALVGQKCFKPGMAKNTYGTGCFLLYNVGPDIVHSTTGMLSTVAYQMGKDTKPIYALEGSIAIAGAAVSWLKDNLGLIREAKEIEDIAKEVEDNGGVYFVPAFSGLFAPYWRPDARGVICGLTQFTKKAHICRATLEAICFQTREVVEAMDEDSGLKLTKLLVDGGMSRNQLMMQMQANFLNLEVVRPLNVETTSLGAAMAAGRAVGVWDIFQQGQQMSKQDLIYESKMTSEEREDKFKWWKKAIQKSLNWKDE